MLLFATLDEVPVHWVDVPVMEYQETDWSEIEKHLVLHKSILFHLTMPVKKLDSTRKTCHYTVSAVCCEENAVHFA